MSHPHSHDHGPSGAHAHHQHGHGTASGDFSTANREFFDQHAASYDDKPQAEELMKRLVPRVLESYAFDEDKTSVLDFACGTGLMSRALAPHAKSIVGVDISQGMVDQYNLRVSNQGIEPEEMAAIRAELNGEPGELEDRRFDVAVCSMAYHHFESIDTITKTLTYFLKSGGVLIVADLLATEDGTDLHPGPNEAITPEQFDHIVPHRAGFSEAMMRQTFEGAGLQDFELRPAGWAKDFFGSGKTVKFFVAKANKKEE